MNRCCANLHICASLRVLTLRTSSYTSTYSQVYIWNIIDTLVHEPLLCKRTYLCALASAHILILCVYSNIFRSVHISYHRCLCIPTRAVHSHTCLYRCECSHLEPVCIHIFKSGLHGYMSIYIYRIKDSFVHKPTLCELTYVCALASAHT